MQKTLLFQKKLFILRLFYDEMQVRLPTKLSLHFISVNDSSWVRGLGVGSTLLYAAESFHINTAREQIYTGVLNTQNPNTEMISKYRIVYNCLT